MDYKAIANDDDIVAMIGPTTSVHAKTAATAFNAKQKTLITIIATSTEFQRIYSSKPNVFYHIQDEPRQLISQWQDGPLLFAPGSEDDAVVFDQISRNASYKKFL